MHKDKLPAPIKIATPGEINKWFKDLIESYAEEDQLANERDNLDSEPEPDRRRNYFRIYYCIIFAIEIIILISILCK